MKIILFFLCCMSPAVFSQDDAWIYFAEKTNVEMALQNPNTILSQQAIDRKRQHDITIDQRDVPVNLAYIKAISSLKTVRVLAKSKWMNAIHVRGDLAEIKTLLNFEFVAGIDFADKNLTDLKRPALQNSKFQIEATLEDFNYGNAQNQTDMIQAKALHLDGFTGKGISIAVFDSGFPNVNTMKAFERLRAQQGLKGGYDFVERTTEIFNFEGSSHGTRVLSTMAGYLDAEFVGTAPDATYYLFRTEDVAHENPVEESYWVEAAERADSLGVHIITSSLGYNTFDNPKYNYTPAEMNGVTTFISRGASIAAEKGILVVNSAGNSGSTPWQIVTAPADAESVFTVGAVDATGAYATFSSRGSADQPTYKPDVVAQGLGTFVITETESIVKNNGTSFSTPIIAGAMASLWQAMPGATAAQLKRYVRESASQSASPDYYLGYGIPNFKQALAATLSSQNLDVKQVQLYPNPVSELLYLKLPNNHEHGILRIYNLLGKQLLEQEYHSNPLPVDVSKLATGMYLLTIHSGHNSYNLKFIKS
ncbi:S8 family serine peptidase [Gelidibacter salicanalis]|uniref:S8 family serine peptidase n=1 Tax=Gelidibacter salicanalis TaxID=291193 RepID=A0A5C7ABN7_9FLAO|nr:S8 family serine peptidase [Gelidibacter salicanalis]TXE05811.1 S8 family serine peptidase [Gelidibacter salicanalis]